MEPETYVRAYLAELLDGHGAHIPFSAAVEGIPMDLAGRRLPHLDHTLWQLVDHIRICQWDIVAFSRDPAHVSPEYPSGYWPREDGPADAGTWERALAAVQQDTETMKAMILDPANDLFQPLAHGDGQTLLREAVLIADHNAYHIGQIVDLRMLLGIKVRDW
jgi:hypothetical protein